MTKYHFLRVNSERSTSSKIMLMILALLCLNVTLGVILYQHTSNPDNYTYSASEPSSAVVTSNVILTKGDDEEPDKYHVIVQLPSGDEYGVYVGDREELYPGDTLDVWTAPSYSSDVYSVDVGNGRLGLYDNEDLRVSVKNFKVAEASGVQSLYVYGATFGVILLTLLANLLFLVLWRTKEAKQDILSIGSAAWSRRETKFTSGYCALFALSGLALSPSIGALYSGATGGMSALLATAVSFIMFLVISLLISWLSLALPKVALRETRQTLPFGHSLRAAPKAHYSLK